MADEIEKALEKEAIAARSQTDELSHEDSEKIVGGAPTISEIVVTKPTDIASTKL